jgi:hypothetical protein
VAGVQAGEGRALVVRGEHRLRAPMLGHADALPVPQREALRTAFGLCDDKEGLR